MSSTVIRVPRITGLPIIIAGLISIRSVVIAIPLTHHSAPARVSQSPLITSSRKTPRLSLASKSGLYERAKRRMAHPFKSKRERVDWIREKAPNADRVSFWLRTEASGTEGALWFLLDVIFTPVGNKFRG